MAHPNKAATLILGAVTSLATFLSIGLALLLALNTAPKAVGAEDTLFHIERGEGASAVAARLEARGLIRSSFFLRIMTRVLSLETSIKAGTYRIEKGLSAMQILDILVSGKQILIKVTIPEGYTLSRVAVLLDANGITSAEDFIEVCRDRTVLDEFGIPAGDAQGYLFPDTYLMPLGLDAAQVVRMMLEAFFARVEELHGSSSPTPENLHRMVILASLIEREYRVADEAPLMASVFNNRLRIGMALQSCASVVYIITEKLKKPHPEVLYDRDIAIKDPYNTYIHPGLPPGPISNPGMTALNAVFNPAKSRYLYFRLVDPESGRHHFSESLEEHIGARALQVKRAGD